MALCNFQCLGAVSHNTVDFHNNEITHVHFGTAKVISRTSNTTVRQLDWRLFAIIVNWLIIGHFNPKRRVCFLSITSLWPFNFRLIRILVKLVLKSHVIFLRPIKYFWLFVLVPPSRLLFLRFVHSFSGTVTQRQRRKCVTTYSVRFREVGGADA